MSKFLARLLLLSGFLYFGYWAVQNIDINSKKSEEYRGRDTVYIEEIRPEEPIVTPRERDRERERSPSVDDRRQDLNIAPDNDYVPYNPGNPSNELFPRARRRWHGQNRWAYFENGLAVLVNDVYTDSLVERSGPPFEKARTVYYFRIVDLSVGTWRTEETSDFDFYRNASLTDGNNTSSSRTHEDERRRQYQELNPGSLRYTLSGSLYDKVTVGSGERATASREIPFFIGMTRSIGGGDFDESGKPTTISYRYEPYIFGTTSLVLNGEAKQLENIDLNTVGLNNYTWTERDPS